MCSVQVVSRRCAAAKEAKLESGRRAAADKIVGAIQAALKVVQQALSKVQTRSELLSMPSHTHACVQNPESLVPVARDLSFSMSRIFIVSVLLEVRLGLSYSVVVLSVRFAKRI